MSSDFFANRPRQAACLLALVLFAFPASLVWLEQPRSLSAQELPLSAETPRNVEFQEKILVLNDGKVVKGLIAPLELGYAVELGAGRITIPFEMVICEASTLPEAYRKQRDAMTKPTAEQHTRLASWCIQQKLFSEAERELESALRLQPQYHQARRLIEQLENRKPKDSDFTDKELKGQIERMIIQQEFGETRPIGDLEPELAQEFVTKIEPLLMNSCSNSSCHSSRGGNELKLTRKWNTRGNTKHITAQNLQSVLAQINGENPAQSPLLTKIREPHGPRKVQVFSGPRGAEHFRTLEQWTLRVGKSLPATQNRSKESPIQQAGFRKYSPNPGNSSTQAATPARQPAPFVLTSEEAAAMKSAQAEMQQANEQDKPETPQSTPLVEEIRKTQAPDPFDPAIFNRLKHGRIE